MTRHASFVRTLFVCVACAPLAGTLGAQAAIFPLLITAMNSQVRGMAEAACVAAQLVSHMISAASAAALVMLDAGGRSFAHGPSPVAFSIGCLLLLALQFTRLRHPPAMASGGAVLCGIDPVAVIGCSLATGLVLYAEPLVRGFARRES